jgi:serine/threonine protein kinase
MALSLHFFHAAFPGMVHNDVKPNNFLCMFAANKFKEALDAKKKKKAKTQKELLALLGKIQLVVLADFGLSLPRTSDKPYATSVGSANGTPWYQSPESACITTSNRIIFQGNDIYSLAISIISLCIGLKTVEDHQNDSALSKNIDSSEWKNQEFVAMKNTELLDNHKEVFHAIFGEKRTEGLKKMLWFVPQEQYPDEAALTLTHKTRRVGMQIFLGQDEAVLMQSLSSQQLMTPLALSQSTQYNLTQVPPLAPSGSRAKLYRGEQLVAQANARVCLGMNESSEEVPSSSSSQSSVEIF